MRERRRELHGAIDRGGGRPRPSDEGGPRPPTTYRAAERERRRTSDSMTTVRATDRATDRVTERATAAEGGFRAKADFFLVGG